MGGGRGFFIFKADFVFLVRGKKLARVVESREKPPGAVFCAFLFPLRKNYLLIRQTPNDPSEIRAVLILIPILLANWRTV